MNKNKGFTLIELLAVIVILAILMVVAVPKILNVIENSRKSVAESSIKLVKDAIRMQVSSGSMMGTNFTSDEIGCYTFNFDDQEKGNAKELQLKNKEKITGTIKYCNGKFSEDTLNFDGNSISKDDTNKKIICKRATTLHTDGTYTFGNIGVTEKSLKSGDAFDCDVNGDGEYDSDTERFYYVTDLDDSTAVLIYYNNISDGKPSNNTKYAYDASGENHHGPVTAIEQLPSTSEWGNVSLKNTSRAILNEKGTNTSEGVILPDSFSYHGKASRLLTIQEINSACNISAGSYVSGELNNCNYLMENTTYSNSSIGNYGYWIENPLSGYSKYAWHVDSYHQYVGDGIVSKAIDYGVRPVVEVSKSNIEY